MINVCPHERQIIKHVSKRSIPKRETDWTVGLLKS